jgi:hypothetical protein
MPMRTQRGSRGIATLMPNHGSLWGLVFNIANRPFYFRERAQVGLPVVVEAGWVKGSIRTGLVMRSHAVSEVRDPDRPARSELLYRPTCCRSPLFCANATRPMWRRTDSWQLVHAAYMEWRNINVRGLHTEQGLYNSISLTNCRKSTIWKYWSF